MLGRQTAILFIYIYTHLFTCIYTLHLGKYQKTCMKENKKERCIAAHVKVQVRKNQWIYQINFPSFRLRPCENNSCLPAVIKLLNSGVFQLFLSLHNSVPLDSPHSHFFRGEHLIDNALLGFGEPWRNPETWRSFPCCRRHSGFFVVCLLYCLLLIKCVVQFITFF